MIRVESLSFAYPGTSDPAVRDLSFEVGQGEIFGFLGPSGAGKSTTQNILIGLISGWSGTVEVMGRPLQQWGTDYYRQVGVSFELPNHYLKLTARENLDLFRALHGAHAASPEEAMAWVGLGDHLDKPVGSFSKGMKNRLNFARSLLHHPTLWFLDEPTAGLDPVTAVRIRELIKARQADGITTFLTTHDMHTADVLCDRVAFIVDGRLIEVGPPEALRRAHGSDDVVVTWAEPDGASGSARFPLAGLGDNAAFVEALRGREVRSLHSQESSLEDVFVQVTGTVLQ